MKSNADRVGTASAVIASQCGPNNSLNVSAQHRCIGQYFQSSHDLVFEPSPIFDAIVVYVLPIFSTSAFMDTIRTKPTIEASSAYSIVVAPPLHFLIRFVVRPIALK